MPDPTCINCPHHQVLPDPDPDDWFCDDDKKVVCTKVEPPKNVAVAIRPYKLRVEALVPDWCPLKVRS